jgi:hypothetical protein
MWASRTPALSVTVYRWGDASTEPVVTPDDDSEHKLTDLLPEIGKGFFLGAPEGGFFKGVLSQKVAHWDEMHQLAPAMPGQRWARSEIGTASPASNVATQARSLPG